MRRQPGLVSFVDVGCRVYSTERRRATSNDEVPVGGLVVDVTEKLDRETGETDRAFLVFDDQQSRPFIRWAVLREVEVDRGLIEAVDTGALARAWRRLAEDIHLSAPHRPRRGPGLPAEVRSARAILELQAVVFGHDGEQWADLAPATPGKAVLPPPSYAPAPGSVFVD
jgi:hypothetical protein